MARARLLAAALLVIAGCTRATPEGSPQAQTSPTIQPPTGSTAPTRAKPQRRPPTVSWEARIGEATEIEIMRGVVYVSTPIRVYAFPTRCDRKCRPLWKAEPSGEMGVASGMVYVATDDGRLYGYRPRCRSDGGRCSPLFSTQSVSVVQREIRFGTEQWITGLSFGRDHVYISLLNLAAGGKPEFGVGRVYAFPADCFGRPTCSHSWKTPLFDALLDPPTVARNDVYVGSGSGLHVFSSHCGAGGVTCKPEWHHRAGMHGGMGVDAPIVEGDLVLISGSHGQHGANGHGARVFAFSTRCGDRFSCDPLWRFHPRATFLSPPVVTDKRVFIETSIYPPGHRGAFAFSLRCIRQGGPCEPVWAERREGEFMKWPSLAPGMVFAASTQRGLAIIPTRCANAATAGCEPVTTLCTSGDFPSVGRDGTKFFLSRREIAAFASGQGPNTSCHPLWTWSVSGEIRTPPVEWQNRVFVAAGGDLVSLNPPY